AAEQRQGRAQRRLLAAVKQLALVRKLLVRPPAPIEVATRLAEVRAPAVGGRCRRGGATGGPEWETRAAPRGSRRAGGAVEAAAAPGQSVRWRARAYGCRLGAPGCRGRRRPESRTRFDLRCGRQVGASGQVIEERGYFGGPQLQQMA